MAVRAQWPVGAALLAVCAALGVLAGINPLLAVAAAVFALFATLVAADLTAGLCVFIVVAFAERIPAVGGSDVTLVKALGGLLAVSWLASVATHRAGDRQFFSTHPGMTAMAGMLLAWMLLSAGWAEDPAVAREEVMRYALNLTLLPIVFSAVQRREHVGAVLGVYVGGATLAALYAIVTRDPEGLGRAAGVAGTANELASLAVTALILAGGLILGMRQAPLVRALLVVSALICAAALAASLSRGGLVALGAAMVAAIVVGGRARLGTAVVVSLVGLAVVGYFAFGASEEARERVTTLGSGTGRTDIWTVGWRMVEAEPVRGVGVGNFQTSSIHYLLEPGAILRDDFIVDEPQVAHNAYLHVLAETGVIGLALYLGLLGAGRRLRRCAPPAGSRAAATSSWRAAPVPWWWRSSRRSSADLFVSEQLSKSLWLLLGIGPALLAIARTGRSP